jgi:murein DD-endopeptidase MepM/ murein hydrolase activator NlpD
MKSLSKLVVMVMLVPMGCAFLFVALYIVFVGLTIPQLPSWAHSKAEQWMMDIPQDSDFIPGVDVAFGQQATIPANTSIPWIGYSDSTNSGIDGVPLVMPSGKKPMLGCPFGRNLGYTMNGGIHNGADWPIPSGTPVQTVMAGKVAYASFDAAGGAWGGLVVIENGDYQVWYGHMEQVNVAAGQIVDYGDIVGFSDNLGNSTGPHLHLGVKMKGTGANGKVQSATGGGYWINPMQFIDPSLYIIGTCSGYPVTP